MNDLVIGTSNFNQNYGLSNKKLKEKEIQKILSLAKKNNINYIDVYSEFIGKDKRLNILDTFIFGDLHWNKKGTKIIFDKLVSEIF